MVMAGFSSLMSNLGTQSFLGLYLPYLVIFIVVGAIMYHALDRVTAIHKLDKIHSIAVKALIILVLGGLLSIIIRNMIFGLTGV